MIVDFRIRLVRVGLLIPLLVVLAWPNAAAQAAAGPCYTVTVDDGEPDPPSVTLCPFD